MFVFQTTKLILVGMVFVTLMVGEPRNDGAASDLMDALDAVQKLIGYLAEF